MILKFVLVRPTLALSVAMDRSFVCPATVKHTLDSVIIRPSVCAQSWSYPHCVVTEKPLLIVITVTDG